MKKYIGNKNIPGVLHKIINNVPKHKKYIELFAGSGAIGCYLHSSVSNCEVHFNDIDVSTTAKYDYTAGSLVTNFDYFIVLQSLLTVPAGTDVFVFIDPPYLHSTRPNHVCLYSHEMSDDDHIKLLSTVVNLKCNVMIIHPICPLYDEFLKDFRKVEVKIRYHGKTSIEALYMNYSDNFELHNCSLVGSDCWDRQRIKRKSDRILKKILSLPANEKQFIFSELKKVIY